MSKADRFVEEVCSKNPNMLVPYYLMLSYLYYELDQGLVSDEVFDRICKRLLERWEAIEHFHKHLIDFEALAAGTGYYLSFPLRVKCGATALWFRFNPPPKRVDPLDLAFYEAGFLVIRRGFYSRKGPDEAVRSPQSGGLSAQA